MYYNLIIFILFMMRHIHAKWRIVHLRFEDYCRDYVWQWNKFQIRYPFVLLINNKMMAEMTMIHSDRRLGENENPQSSVSSLKRPTVYSVVVLSDDCCPFWRLCWNVRTQGYGNQINWRRNEHSFIQWCRLLWAKCAGRCVGSHHFKWAFGYYIPLGSTLGRHYYGLEII